MVAGATICFMNENDRPTNESEEEVAAKIEQADAKLTALEAQLHEIGRPAANHLFERLNALRVEERALKRNFEETRGRLDRERLAKLEALLHHIEREEASVEHEAAFLGQSNPSSVTLAAEAGSRMVDAVGRKLGKVFHGHHPLGSSVFVNHTHDSLVSYHGLRDDRSSENGPGGV